MYNDDSMRFKHILDMSYSVVTMVKGHTRQDIDTDEKLRMAVLYALIIIGEAASYISDSFKEKHSDIPWKKITGMRNRVVHGYFDTDLDIVWEAVTRNIPNLIEQLEKNIEIQP